MKSQSFLALVAQFLMGIFFIGTAHAGSENLEQQFLECSKMYITHEQVGFHENKIFVHLGEEWFQTKGIASDENGLYFSSINSRDINDKTQWWSWTWACPECKFENSPFSKTCKNCHYDPGKKS